MMILARAIFALIVMLAGSACAGGQPAAPSHPPANDPSANESEPPELTNEEVPVPAEAACGGKSCTPPEQCIRYSGIGGPSMPLFTCGVPCDEQGECPTGMQCATIADGPRLCR
jgi:hypothetical protein